MEYCQAYSSSTITTFIYHLKKKYLLQTSQDADYKIYRLFSYT